MSYREIVWQRTSIYLLALLVIATSTACGAPTVPPVAPPQPAVTNTPPLPPSQASPTATAPLPFPEQEIQLLCAPGEGPATHFALYRAMPATGSWVPELSGRTFTTMYALPQDDGVLLQEAAPLRTLLWQRGQEQLLFSGDALATKGEMSPNGRKLILYENPNTATPTLSLLHLDNCNVDGCQRTPLAGIPVWSPNGTRTLVNHPYPNPHQLSLGDGDAASLVPLGARVKSPFWLDSETYGYLHPVANPGTPPQIPALELVTVSVTDRIPQPLLDVTTLQSARPAGDASSSAFLEIATANRARPEQLILYAVVYDEETLASGHIVKGTRILTLERPSGTLSLLRQGGLLYDLRFSANGRWLALKELDLEEANRDAPLQSSPVLHLFDLQQSRLQQSLRLERAFTETPFTGYDWSKDGRWLLLVESETLRLIAPAEDYHHTFPLPTSNCADAAWVAP